MASLLLPMMATNPYTAAALGIVGALIDNYIVSSLTSGTTVEQGKMSDLDVQTATLGSGIVKGYGTTRVTGNLIWGTKFTEHITEDTQGGGKGGGGQKVTTKTYSYSASFAILLCEGQISSIKKVFADGTEFDLSSVDYRLYTGTETQNPDDFMEGIEGAGYVPAYRGMAYIVFRNMNLSDYGNRIPSFSFIIEYPKNTVQEIVEDISADAGLVIDQDVSCSALNGLKVDGFTRSGDETYKDQIDSLRTCKIFDGAERRGIVVFRQRDFSNVIPIAYTDYGAYDTSKADNPLETTVAHDMSLPKKLTVNYVSSDNDYQTGVQAGYRQVTGATTETSVSTNVVMNDSTAKEVAELRLYEAWIARTTHKFNLSNKYGWLLPGDILEVALKNGDKQLMQITGTNYGRPGINIISSCNVHSGVYTVVTRAVDSTPMPIVETPSEMFYSIMDLPKLPSDSTEGDNYIYYATGAISYYGANVYRSTDSGSNYKLIAQNNQLGIIGTAATVLEDAPSWSWDNANAVTVNVPYGALESHTRDEVINLANVALLGNEIIQYKTATLISEGVYQLSGLLRGRFGTERYTGSHIVGEKFVVLNTSSINYLTVSSDNWYQDVLLKIGPRNKGILDTTYKTATFNPQGIMAKPWAGCHCRVIKDGNTYTVKWLRRTRKNGTWKNYSDVPLNETAEIYSIDVLDGSENVIDTISATTTEFTYTGSNVAGFNIYQLSDTRGRGWPLEWRI